MQIQSPRQHIKKLAEYSPDEYDIWFLDEVLFQQQGSRCRMWIPPEIKQPVVMQEPGRKSAGDFGAVRLREGKFAQWLNDVMIRLPDTPISQLDSLLPNQWHGSAAKQTK